MRELQELALVLVPVLLTVLQCTSVVLEQERGMPLIEVVAICNYWHLAEGPARRGLLVGEGYASVDASVYSKRVFQKQQVRGC